MRYCSRGLGFALCSLDVRGVLVCHGLVPWWSGLAASVLSPYTVPYDQVSFPDLNAHFSQRGCRREAGVSGLIS